MSRLNGGSLSVLQNYDLPATADSLMRVTRTWTLDDALPDVYDVSGTGIDGDSLHAWFTDPVRYREWATAWPLFGESVDLVAWASPDILVLAGWSEVQHPRFESGAWAYIQVPTIWVADARTFAVKRYQGAPVDPRVLPAVRESLASLTIDAGR